MTTTMMNKIAAAKEMVAYFVEHGLIDDGATTFTPTEYDAMRRQWDAETPTWATLKKYAVTAGLVEETVAHVWHSDGSMIAALSGIKDGTVFYHIRYHF